MSQQTRPLLGFVAFALIAGGVSGILREIFGWDGALFGFLRFLIPDGQEYFGYGVLTAIGIAVADAASRLRP
ncbi:hypothetical protein SRB5_42910 [Streptomyces sp. RB5]|uniref:Uncharacterized protein n=1 Tax=Streptomyces smaragdinus TaxID=2585196 RepID=A0A7K0CKV7_9ACTN|nr:hypothetical protein [Streptomyces smaragdinus]MQY14129.1 hypothetical protein [Streptomyces smaragdinus]